MAVAKKLPSGSWRCQVYSHTEKIPQPDGTVKKKRIYESFTNDDPTTRGKRQCEKQAAINEESRRPSKNCSKNPRPLSPKRVLNEWGLVASVINKYGLKESKSISGDYITIVEVVVDVDRKPLRKSLAKNYNRNRCHKIDAYYENIMQHGA